MSAFDNLDFQAPKNGEALVVVFREPTEDEMIKDEKQSRDLGHAVYTEQIICEIRIPADRNRVMATPHWAPCMVDGQWTTYAERFPREFQRYMEKKGPSVVGTPLHEAPFISASKRAELRALNVHTLEILAGLSGQPLKNLGIGGMTLQQQAKEWLDTAKSTAGTSKLAADNADLRAQLEFMKAEIAAIRTGGAMQSKQIEEPDYNAEGNFDEVPTSAETSTTSSKYEHWDDIDLKMFIKQQTGEGVRGNPSHATLVARAGEVAGYDRVE